MASNKYTVADRSSLLKSKLEALSTKLQESVESSDFQTKEEYIFESIKILRSFYKDLKGPILLDDIAHADVLPNADDYNDLWQSLLSDLTTVFSELENIESLTIGNFNFITTESNRIRTRLKSVSSKLGDFILYSVNPLKDVLFFKDSFNDLVKIDINTDLLNDIQCEINQDEGIVTLPIDRNINSIVSVNNKPLINTNSNGVNGNNQQIGTAFNGDISAILDNNSDTWFEYERVESIISDNTESLRLDLTLNLGDPKIINNIVINPNNFGTRLALRILSIDTSIDGVLYVSIKDDIPISGFTTEDEENIFSLAPSTSKFAGQGIYTFTPRKIKYIRIVLEQDEPYIIDTPTGEKLRYAIGIRDIEVNSFQYELKGEVISQPFTLGEEIRKVLLDTTQTPSQNSELVSIKYFISPDDGIKWVEIQPKTQDALSGIESSVPEILNFNSVDEGSVNTESPVQSMRVKIVLERNSEAFTDGTSSLKKEIVNRNELKLVPTDQPFTLELNNPPVDGTVSVVNPLYGSRGLPEVPYIVASAANGQQIFRLPKEFVNLAWPDKKVDAGSNRWFTQPVLASEWMHIEVAGEEWSHATAAISGLTDAGKVYTYNKTDGELQFGNGTSADLPADLASIILYFDEERIFPNAGVTHTAQLKFPTSNNKSGITIRRRDDLVVTSKVISKSATVIRLDKENITTRGESLIQTVLESSDTGLVFSTKVPYINGRDELTSVDHWSIDTKNGVVYLGHLTPADRDVTLEFEYQSIVTLSESDWEFISDGAIRDKISIKETGWKTRTIKSATLSTIQNLTVLHLEHFNIAEETLKPVATISGLAIQSSKEPFFKEAKFINGSTELGADTLKKATEFIPTLNPSGASNIATFTLKENISTDIKNRVSFLKGTFFIVEQSTLGAVTTVGDYFIDRAARIVHVKLTSATSITDTEERITYWFIDASRGTDGVYSVDYANGIIYLQRPINPNDTSGYTVSADYEYSDFTVKYRIARQLEDKDFSVDITNSEVIISEREILNNLLVPKPNTASIRPYYIVNYDSITETREDIESLEPFFSPIVKDYILKVIPESRII